MTGTAAQTPVMDVMEIPAEPQVFQSGTQSTGLELVDTYLWIFKHFMEGGLIAQQIELFKSVADEWQFGNLFTSSISNYNISAPFHRDAGNIVGAVNIIICKRKDSKGGDLHVPDYGATIGQVDN